MTHKPPPKPAAGPFAPLPDVGWAVWERGAREAGVATIRGAVADVLAEVAPSALWSAETVPLGERAVITPTGFAIPRLLTERPELAPLVLPDGLWAAVCGVLGADARLELLGAVVTDRTRPFFRWHTHINGEDESTRLRAGHWPTFQRLRRIFTLLYLDDIGADSGPLLIKPRRVGEPCGPLDDLDVEAWAGQVELQPAAGTLVAIDECTWHAARAMTRDGERMFVGAYFAAADIPPAPWADEALAAFGPPASALKAL